MAIDVLPYLPLQKLGCFPNISKHLEIYGKIMSKFPYLSNLQKYMEIYNFLSFHHMIIIALETNYMIIICYIINYNIIEKV